MPEPVCSTVTKNSEEPPPDGGGSLPPSKSPGKPAACVDGAGTAD